MRIKSIKGDEIPNTEMWGSILTITDDIPCMVRLETDRWTNPQGYVEPPAYTDEFAAMNRAGLHGAVLHLLMSGTEVHVWSAVHDALLFNGVKSDAIGAYISGQWDEWCALVDDDDTVSNVCCQWCGTPLYIDGFREEFPHDDTVVCHNCLCGTPLPE